MSCLSISQKQMFNESLLYFGKEGCTSITKLGSSNQSCTNNKKDQVVF